MSNPIVTKVVEQLETFPNNLQHQVLQIVEALKNSVQRGIPGRELLRFAGVIPLDDLELTRQTIETGCEQVDLNEW